MKWSQLRLVDELVQKLESMKYRNPLEVQEKVIPLVLKSEDVVVQSKTGSGKTLAFILPVLNFLLKNNYQLNNQNKQQNNELLALIIVPTRVLALQIVQVFREFGVPTAQVIGGQNEKFNQNILIATPGKLSFAVVDNKINLQKLRFLIIDEADKTLQMEEIIDVIKQLPKQQRVSMLFSATLNVIKDFKILNQISTKFVQININEQQNFEVPENLDCFYIQLPIEYKIYYLVQFLQQTSQKIVVFTLTCNFSLYLYQILTQIQQQHNYFKDRQITYLYGKMETSKQLKNYNLFVDSPNSILITTDIASRGLDVESLNSVVQFDPPKCLETFIHRCGRTARNGNHGRACIFLTNKEIGIVKILYNKGLPIFEKKINQYFTKKQGQLTLDDDVEIYNELDVNHNQIKMLKKQLKKYDWQKEEQKKKGLTQKQVDMQFSKAVDSVNQQLQPLLQSEKTQFELELRIYNFKLTQFLRQLELEDRQMLDTAQQAFVSYICAYKEYQLKILLNLENVKLGPLAMSMGMLVLPNVAELHSFYINFKSVENRLETITYKNEKMEQQRQTRMKLKQERDENDVDDEKDENDNRSGKSNNKKERQNIRDKNFKKEQDQQEVGNIDQIIRKGNSKQLTQLLLNNNISEMELEQQLEKLI